jgi:putative tryptophan/tyrosine transport system substrate-binding protein
MAAVWPLSARAQQSEGVRRIGVLMGNAANDPEGQARISAFLQGLRELGWSVDDNVRIDIRWTSGNDADIHKFAVELVALAPDVILSSGTPPVTALQQATRTVPIVFTVVADPVGGGVVDSLARPGGNATGFISQEYGLSAKQLELLKQVAPLTTRVGVVRDPTTSAGVGQFAAIQSAAPSLAWR